MKQHTDAMKLVTAKYAHALSQLEKLRAMELDIGNNIHQDRYDEQQLTYVTEVMAKNQRKAARMVSKLTGVQDILS